MQLHIWLIKIKIKIKPNRIYMKQSSPIFGDMEFDSDQTIEDSQLSEEQLALKGEVMKALELRSSFLINANSVSKIESEKQEEADFTSNPFQFVNVPKVAFL